MNTIKKILDLGLFFQKEAPVQEKIYGNIAIAYHRFGRRAETQSSETGKQIADTIAAEGFQPGPGATYGVGMYATYELEDQLEPKMARTYGSFILKLKIPLDRFLIFDMDIAKQVYKENWRLKDQYLSLGFRQNERIDARIGDLENQGFIDRYNYPMFELFTSIAKKKFVIP